MYVTFASDKFRVSLDDEKYRATSFSISRRELFPNACVQTRGKQTDLGGTGRKREKLGELWYFHVERG